MKERKGMKKKREVIIIIIKKGNRHRQRYTSNNNKITTQSCNQYIKSTEKTQLNMKDKNGPDNN